MLPSFNLLTGPRFGEAFQEPASFVAIEPLFEVVYTISWYDFCFYLFYKQCSSHLRKFCNPMNSILWNSFLLPTIGDLHLFSFCFKWSLNYLTNVLFCDYRKRDIWWHITHQKIKSMHCSRIKQNPTTFLKLLSTWVSISLKFSELGCFHLFFLYLLLLQAHVLLHFICSTNANRHSRKRMSSNKSKLNETIDPRNLDFLAHIAESCKIVSSSYGVFKEKAAEEVTNNFFPVCYYHSLKWDIWCFWTFLSYSTSFWTYLTMEKIFMASSNTVFYFFIICFLRDG